MSVCTLFLSLGMTLSASPALRQSAMRLHAPQMAAESTLAPAAAGQQVAQWCVSAGREQATVAVSSATTLPSVMADFWSVVRSLATDGGPVGRQRVLALPYWREDARMFEMMLDHISTCGELCEYLGESMLVAGRHPSGPTNEDEPQAAPCPLLLLRSFSQVAPSDFADENGFDDPFAAMTVEDEGIFATGADEKAADLSDEGVTSSTQAWIGSLAGEIGMGEGDYTPTGATELSYDICRGTVGEDVYEALWRRAVAMAAEGQSGPSATLLVAPRFAVYNAGGFEAFAYSLNTALSSLGLGEDVQLLFFHPLATLSDDDVANGIDFERTSPHPMVALLRTTRVEQTRTGGFTGSLPSCTLIELHERLCGPEGGLLATGGGEEKEKWSGGVPGFSDMDAMH